MSTDREAILSRVRGALAPLPHRSRLPNWEDELIHLRSRRESVDPWTLFSERLAHVHGTPLVGPGALGNYLQGQNWLRGYCAPELWPLMQAALPAPFVVSAHFDRNRVDDYQFGITRAAGAIAETGTVILKDASTSSRLAALAPWVHIAVLSRADIFTDLQEAVLSLGQDPNIIWCTGPSKTADVEGILIEGVHGPGIQVVLLVD